MSIFSHIRRSRQQAKEHAAKLAEQDKKAQQTQPPYRHVPTHAASDAFASAPPSWREQDRPRILEENRRRSALAAAGHHMNMPRVGTSHLSLVSYPADDVSPMVRLSRASSYAARRYPSTDVSPGESSSGDDVDIPATLPYPPRSRRNSDASSDHRPHRPASAKRSGPSALPRDPRPPPSMRGFASIARLSQQPPSPPPHFVSSPLVRRASANASSSSSSSSHGSLTPRQDSASSLHGLESPPSIWPSTPQVMDRDPPRVYKPVSPQFGPQGRKAVAVPRHPFSEVDASEPRLSRPERAHSLPPLSHADLVNVFPESTGLYVPAPSVHSTKGDKHSSKGVGRLVKRSRWLGSNASAVAV
ncbi:hypothetical protein L249_4334 [Ophiocordyceps polyrhachis-furcata BCC 54312]|uniref:Uncharacterized protein n=1 Tax=Ophiocordyceps polyrhachis-furcata BCC 54312 TaxID=1330021 RepID=A0A367L7V5_9HYPO|nr:hypothetical protein L249_4334 [Ophiocordyceps polyrhachis-furcata BCC 54312]